MEKKITLFHGSEKIIEYQTYLEMMDDETDGIYINKASAPHVNMISKVLGGAMEALLDKKNSRNCPDSSCCFYRVGLRGRSSQSPWGGSVNTGDPSGWRYGTPTDYW